MPTSHAAHQHDAAGRGVEDSGEFLSELAAEAEAADALAAIIGQCWRELVGVATGILAKGLVGLRLDEWWDANAWAALRQRGEESRVGGKAGPEQQWDGVAGVVSSCIVGVIARRSGV